MTNNTSVDTSGTSQTNEVDYEDYGRAHVPAKFEEESGTQSIENERKTITVNPDSVPEHVKVFMNIAVMVKKERIQELNRKLNPFSD